MTVSFTIHIKGDRETASYLKHISTNLDKGVIEIGESIAGEIVDLARQYVPVDTGKLRESIEVIKTGRNFNIVAGSGLPRPYGIAQERGFEAHPIHTSWITDTTKKFPLDRWITVSKFTPFLRPALAEVVGKMNIKIKNDIAKLMRRR